MRGIANDGQVREFLDDGDSGEIECVARVSFERANAALAENHIVVATSKNVFGAEQQLFHCRRKAALQKNGLANFAERSQQVIVLHVTRAHLEHVHIRKHQLNLRRVHHFADSAKAEFVRRFAHKFQSRLTHPLKSVRRRTGLKGSCPQNFRPCFRNTLRHTENLFARLDRAGPCSHDNFRPAYFDAAS